MTNLVFKEHAPGYRNAGFEPRPVEPGKKACKEKGWNKSDTELPEGAFEKWMENRGHYGIGLRLGAEFSDGTRLAALDIDDDRFVRVAKYLLGNPPCGRIGSKGVAYFVRLRGSTRFGRKVFDITPADGAKVHVGELLGVGGFLVIPPTIHPSTKKPYRWVDKPLPDTPYAELPIIEV